MAWTTPRTWTTGETVTAAMLNEQIRDNGNYLKTQSDIADYEQIKDVVTADGSVVSNTTVETAVWTYNLPANSLSTNKAVRVWFYGALQLTGTDSVTFRLNYGGTTIGSCTISTEYAATRGLLLIGVLRANAATNAQRGMLWADGLTPTLATSAVDSTAAQNIIMTVQFGGAATTKNFTLYMATAELLAAV